MTQDEEYKQPERDTPSRYIGAGRGGLVIIPFHAKVAASCFHELHHSEQLNHFHKAVDSRKPR